MSLGVLRRSKVFGKLKGVGVDEFNRLCRKRLFKGEDYPFSPGDMVRVHFKVVEGNRKEFRF